MADKTISPEVLKRLDNIDFEEIEKRYPGLKDQIVKYHPNVATDLAMGNYSGLFNYKSSKNGVSFDGEIAVHAVPQGEGKPFGIQVLTKHSKLTPDKIYVGKVKIYSAARCEQLLEQGRYSVDEGQTKYGYLNANGGVIHLKDNPKDFFLGLHQPTNTPVLASVAGAAAKYCNLELDENGNIEKITGLKMNKNGEPIARKYGVALTVEQLETIFVKHESAVLKGVDSNGIDFYYTAGYNPSTGDITVDHPSWVQKAEKAGLDPLHKKEREAALVNVSAKAEKPAEKKVEKAAAKKVAKIEKTEKAAPAKKASAKKAPKI